MAVRFVLTDMCDDLAILLGDSGVVSVPLAVLPPNIDLDTVLYQQNDGAFTLSDSRVADHIMEASVMTLARTLCITVGEALNLFRSWIGKRDAIEDDHL